MAALDSPSTPDFPTEPEVDAALAAPERLAAVGTARASIQVALAGWDRLTELACVLLAVPCSFVTVVNADHDDYPSHRGLPQTLGTPASLSGRSFCHYTLALDAMVVIGDTWAQTQTRQVPTVESLGIRAYIGIPLHVDGQPIGSFCVVDTQPRVWSATAVDTVAMMAAAAERELALHLARSRADAEAARAKALVTQRESLMASVAHDLGTPLQLVQLVSWQLRQSASPAQVPLVERLMHAGEAMRRLARDLVREHSLTDQGRSVQRLDVAELLQDAVSMMQPLADRAGIALQRLEGPSAAVIADHAEMLRIFANLIGNALKYTPAGSTVLLQSRAGEAGQVVLSVADDGPGMSESDRAKVFTPGWQGADGQARGDGAGLGMAIVRTLVLRNQGSAAIRAAPGGGTQVELTLPRAD